MSSVQLSEGGSRWFTPLACGPGHPELPKSYMDMASKLFSFVFAFTPPHADHIRCVYWDAFMVPTCTAACNLPSVPTFFDSAMLASVPLLKYD